MTSLEGKTALVTGASRGIGRAHSSGPCEGRGACVGPLWPLGLGAHAVVGKPGLDNPSLLA